MQRIILPIVLALLTGGGWLAFQGRTYERPGYYTLRAPFDVQIVEMESGNLHMFFNRCNRSFQIRVRVEPNPDRLSSSAFVESRPALAGSTLRYEEDYAWIDSMSIKSVMVLIPNHDQIVTVHLRPGGERLMPPFEAPCDSALTSLRNVVNSLEVQK